MPLTDLLRSLDADAAAELAAAMAEHERQAQRILDQAHARSAAIVADAIDGAQEAAEAEADTIRAAAAAEARDIVDRSVLDGLDALLDQTRARLAVLPGTPAGREATLRLLREALEVVPNATWARVHPDDVDSVRTAVPRLDVTGDLDGVGAVVGDEAGRAVDNTAATRLANLWPEHRAAMARGWREST